MRNLFNHRNGHTNGSKQLGLRQPKSFWWLGRTAVHTVDGPHVKGGPRIFFIGGARPKGQRPRAGVGFLERGQQPPPHQLGGLGSIVNSPSGVRGGAAAAQRFFPIFSALKMAFPDTIKLLIADCHAAIWGVCKTLSPLRTPLPYMQLWASPCGQCRESRWRSCRWCGLMCGWFADRRNDVDVDLSTERPPHSLTPPPNNAGDRPVRLLQYLSRCWPLITAVRFDVDSTAVFDQGR